MNTMKSAWVRLLTCCFTAVLLLSIGAGAVDNTESAARQDDLDYLYTTLKSNHPDLFANTPETAFEARKGQIEQRLSTESSFDFALDCASLAALAKDSHTNVSLGSNGYDLHICLFDMDLYDGTWVLSAIDSAHKSLLGSEITAINGAGSGKVRNHSQRGQFGEAAVFLLADVLCAGAVSVSGNCQARRAHAHRSAGFHR